MRHAWTGRVQGKEEGAGREGHAVGNAWQTNCATVVSHPPKRAPSTHTHPRPVLNNPVPVRLGCMQKRNHRCFAPFYNFTNYRGLADPAGPVAEGLLPNQATPSGTVQLLELLDTVMLCEAEVDASCAQSMVGGGWVAAHMWAGG